MTKRMLIDATHAEETRVVVLDDTRLEDFDVETSTKKQLKGNIYLAKVIRVEPSLQSAFVEYGGGRHGFLAFGEIHPDYYQIPVADRQRLLALQAEEARADEGDDDEDEPRPAAKPPQQQQRGQRPPRQRAAPAPAESHQPPDAVPDTLPSEAMPVTEAAPEDASPEGDAPIGAAHPEATIVGTTAAEQPEPLPEEPREESDAEREGRPAQPSGIPRDEKFGDAGHNADGPTEAPVTLDRPGDVSSTDDLDIDPSENTLEEPPDVAFDGAGAAEPEHTEETGYSEAGDSEGVEFEAAEGEILPPPETVGGDADAGDGAEQARQRRESRFLRNYRIQEVIRRRQILLVQVVKEERGTKGAALTTYISLAGRFCVLMPNSPRGGGISRKITSAADRRRLKEITTELEVPAGMGLIVRTAGAARPKPEIVRDCEYLMRLWDDIRDHTLRSMAPALIYEEASLIKRAMRDMYSRDIDEILIDGEAAWRGAHEFMRMLMPAHARKVTLWRGAHADTPGQPLFSKYQVEAQLDAMLSSTVQLKSGGYLVINQTEALVAIDVNSGRSTRERNIEETALKTNLEAADEAARQLRLRDLAGLIVIDFIDMESRRNNGLVEKRMKDALKVDRARIQVGSISHFGLLEMSRQRLRPSVTETSFVPCPACGGQGHVRSTESGAISVLRAIEDEGAKARASLIMVHVANSMVMYLLNHKRARLAEIEARYGMFVQFAADETLMPPALRIDRLRPKSDTERPALAAPVTGAGGGAISGPVVAVAPPGFDGAEQDVEDEDFAEDENEPATASVPTSRAPASRTPAPMTATAGEAERASEEAPRKRRRRRRGGRRDGAAGDAQAAGAPTEGDETFDGEQPDDAPSSDEAGEFRSTEIDPADADQPELAAVAPAVAQAGGEIPDAGDLELDENGQPKARRRGRRGGRRRRREPGEDAEPGSEAATEAAGDEPRPMDPPPAYNGPTPANPFANTGFDLFDLMEQAEEAALNTRPGRPVEPPPTDAPATESHQAPVPQTASVEEAVAEFATVEATHAVAATEAPSIEAPSVEPPVTEALPAEPATTDPVPAVAEADPATQPELPMPQPPAEPKRGWWKR